MSWRDRAIKVSDSEPTKSSWRDRAIPVNEPSIRDIPENFMKDAREIGSGLVQTGKLLAQAPLLGPKTGLELIQGTPLSETTGAKFGSAVVNMMKEAPAAIANRVKEIASDPYGEFKKKPISTTLDVASIIPPIAAATRAVKGSNIISKFSKAGAIASKASKGTRLEDAAIRGIESITMTPEKAIRRRLSRPEMIKTAIKEGTEEAPFLPVADDLAIAVNQIGEKARKSASVADDLLSKSKYLNDGAFTKDSLLGVVNAEKKKLFTQGRIVGDAKKAAAKRIDKLKADVSALRGETVPQSNVKKFIKDLDKDINWAVPENQPSNLALERVRFKLDAKLKKANPEYKDAIAKSAKETRTFKRASRQFGLNKEVGGGFQATDATVSKLKSVGQTRSPILERKLKDVESLSGQDFIERARDIDTALKFEGGVTTGARKAVSGGTIGAGLGGLIGGPEGALTGGALGTVLGLLFDTRGRSIAGPIVDAYAKAGKLGELLKIADNNPRVAALIRRGMNTSTSPMAKRFSGSYLSMRGISPEDSR